MKGKKWKILYGLLLGVVSCLLYNTLFTLKNANAAVIEMDAPTSGWLNCDGNTQAVEWYTAQRTAPYTSLCSKWSETIEINSNVDFYRVRIRFAGTNNEYKFKQDAYAIVVFSIAITGANNITLPTGFIGRNVNVIEEKVDYENIVSSIIPTIGGGSITNGGNATEYQFVNSGTKAIYTLKIRIPAGQVWDGTLDLQQAMTMPTNYNLFRILISSVRVGYIYEPNAAINQEAQQELNDRNNLESQSQQTDSSANNSEQQMQSGTTNLIGAVTSFANAMRNAKTGSCKLPEISAYGMSLGELNLCTYSPPNWVKGLTSTILSLITVGLAWHVFKRIMGIAKGMAGKG